MIRRLLVAAVILLLASVPARAESTRLLKMFSWADNLEPRLGFVVGAVHHWAWDDIEVAPGVYDWAKVDAAHAAERALGKPIMTQIIPSYSSSTRGGWPAGIPYDTTPDHVYARGVPHKVLHGRRVGHIIEDAAGYKMAMPAYDNSTWRRAYYDMVRAFAARYDGEVVVVVMALGLDGETQPAKHGWMTAIQRDSRYAGLEHRWSQFVEQAIGVYANAFVETTSLLNNAPGSQARRYRAEIIAGLAAEGKNVGLKHSGLLPDLDSYTGWGTVWDGSPTVGSWDMINVYSRTLPIALESAHWIPNPPAPGLDSEVGYWSLLGGLTYCPRWMDLHADWFDKMTPATLRWVHEHLMACAPDVAPSAWIVLRDAEFAPSSWGQGGYMGRQGNLSFYVTQTNTGQTPQVMRDQIPVAKAAIESRQARRGTRFAFRLDPTFAARSDRYAVTVTYLDHGTGSWSLDGQTAQRADTCTWQRATFAVDSAEFAITATDAIYIHRLDVMTTAPALQATPTAYIPPTHPPLTDTPTATPTHTYTPTPTATATITPTRTVIPATLTPTPVPVEIEVVCEALTMFMTDDSVLYAPTRCWGGGQ
jgi:hypothetical protein